MTTAADDPQDGPDAADEGHHPVDPTVETVSAEDAALLDRKAHLHEAIVRIVQRNRKLLDRLAEWD